MGLRLAAARTGASKRRAPLHRLFIDHCAEEKLRCRANWVMPRVISKVADELAWRGGKTLELLYLGEKY